MNVKGVLLIAGIISFLISISIYFLINQEVSNSIAFLFFITGLILTFLGIFK